MKSNNRDENGVMGNGCLLEQRRHENIVDEAMLEPTAMVMRMRRLEWVGHVKTKDETENVTAVVEMKMEGKRPTGRLKLR